MTSAPKRPWKVIAPVLLAGVLLALCVLSLINNDRSRDRPKRTMPFLRQWMIEACEVALADDERLCRFYSHDAPSCSFIEIASVVSDNSYSPDAFNWDPPVANEQSDRSFVCPAILECDFPGADGPKRNQFIINVAMRHVDGQWEPVLEDPNAPSY